MVFKCHEMATKSKKKIMMMMVMMMIMMVVTKMPVTLEPGLKRLKFETGYFILLLHGGHFGISRMSGV